MLEGLIKTINSLLAGHVDSQCLIFAYTREYCATLAKLIEKYTRITTRFLTGCASNEVRY